MNLRDALFSPRSVAIVGQSDDPGKTAGRPLKFLRQQRYAGRVYPINARRASVLGERAWPSLASLPEAPDHVYVVTPTEAAIAAVDECARLGVKVVTVLADGFAEAGDVGQAREARLREICAGSSLRLVGPSSLGVVDVRSRSMLTANASFDEDELPAGRIFVASHSGSMIGALFTRGRARGIGFAGLASVGNEVDLSLGDICMATLDDPGIDGYMLFLETLRHADALRRFALAAAARGRPVLAYKLGRSAAARELAVSHTGALAGEDDVASTFLADCGIARVDTLDGLIEGLPLLARVPAAAREERRRVGVVTLTAGGATMVVDPLASRGVTIEPASAATLARLAAAGVEVKPARMVDLTVAGAQYAPLRATLDILLSAPEFDLVLAVIGSSARAQPERTVRPLIDSAGAAHSAPEDACERAFPSEVSGQRGLFIDARAGHSPEAGSSARAGKPLAAFLVPEAPAALAALSQAGVPNFRTPEACADAIAAALARQVPRAVAIHTWLPPAGDGRVLDELEAGALLERRGIARAPVVALDAALARPPALPFPYPVAVKALSAAIAHKTDVGGVVLGVGDGAALMVAIRDISASVADKVPGARMERVLVQPMVAGLSEVLLGYRVDRDVGPLVMVAAGGVLAEISRDRSLRLAPVDLDTARDMIAELRSLIPLRGYRSKPGGDLDALAQAIVAMSQFADDGMVIEAEINPLIVRPAGEGVVAVDALVKLAGKP
jgi:acyl-CoA synthetase (NDP forming)